MGLTSLLALPSDQLPREALDRVFKATLELLVAYKEQVAGATFYSKSYFSSVIDAKCVPFIFVLLAIKILLDFLGLHPFFFLVSLLFSCLESAKEEDGDDDNMDGFQTEDDDDEEDDSDKEMGVDADEADDADTRKLHKLAAQVCKLVITNKDLDFFLE